jgi:hypothetical protein
VRSPGGWLSCLVWAWLGLSQVCDTLSAADWVDERQVGHYVFRSEFPLRDVEETVAGLVELRKDLEATLGLKCRDKLIIVNLFRNRWSYSAYVREHVPDGVGRQALFVAGPEAGRVFAYRHRDLDTDLRHETTHALLHAALPYVPLWLDEGLAEYFEQPANRRFEGSPHRRAIAWANRFGWTPDLVRLEGLTSAAAMTGDDYRDAWGWIHFMLHGPPAARQALDDYLATIPTGREPTPLSTMLRQQIPNLSGAVREHLR